LEEGWLNKWLKEGIKEINEFTGFRWILQYTIIQVIDNEPEFNPYSYKKIFDIPGFQIDKQTPIPTQRLTLNYA